MTSQLPPIPSASPSLPCAPPPSLFQVCPHPGYPTQTCCLPYTSTNLLQSPLAPPPSPLPHWCFVLSACITPHYCQPLALRPSCSLSDHWLMHYSPSLPASPWYLCTSPFIASCSLRSSSHSSRPPNQDTGPLSPLAEQHTNSKAHAPPKPTAFCFHCLGFSEILLPYTCISINEKPWDRAICVLQT